MKQFVFILALCIPAFCFTQAKTDKSTDLAFVLPIAYVDVDTLLTKYKYAIEINELLTRKMEELHLELIQKRKSVDENAQEFQKKIETNAFLSQERAEQEYARIQKLSHEVEQTSARLEQNLMFEQAKYKNQVTDSIKAGINEYNKTANYEIIFSNSGIDNILLANDKYNVTQQVLEFLNSRYPHK